MVFLHLTSAASRSDTLTSVRFRAGNDTSTLERFSFAQLAAEETKGVWTSATSSWAHGVCATKSTEVVANAAFDSAGTANQLRYAVVSFQRGSFPQDLATDLQVEPSDSCDAENWSLLWTIPVPGSVVYDESGRVLLSSRASRTPAIDTLDGFDVSGNSTNVTIATAQNKPSASLRFPDARQPKQCERDPALALGSDSLKFAQCNARIKAKYAAPIDAAKRARDAASSLLAFAAANGRYKKLMQDSGNAWDRECAPIERDANKKWSDARDRIINFYSKTPYVSPFDRPAETRLVKRGLNGHRLLGEKSE